MKRLLQFVLAVCWLGLGVQAAPSKITEDNWRDLLKGEWMVEFFAPWCPACRGLQPTWEEFATWSTDLEIGIGQVDVTESPGLSGRFMVTALPTIFHVKDGVFRQYRGARDKDSFIAYIEEKKWTNVEAVSEWKSPDSLQMSLVAHFFKLSMVLRNVHTSLTEEYHLPSWASYGAFALATILLGGILGLVLVCCIDCIYPPSRKEEFKPPAPATKREDKKDSDMEDDDDEEEENSQEEGDSQDGSQDEMSGSQDEAADSQDEEAGSQDEAAAGSQDEAAAGSQDEGRKGEDEEESFRAEADNKSRKRKPRKAD